jgi:alkylation response protein AidB-like acyl-CoA dehydrogenase
MIPGSPGQGSPIVDETWLPALLAAARDAGGRATPSIAAAARFGADLPLPGHGDTGRRWAALAAVSEIDLTAGRVLEAHSDALAVLAEAGEAASVGSWGVFAAESPGARLDASADSGWTVRGSKPWCSLGGQLDHALVTAHTDDGRALFAVDLRDGTVKAEPPGVWVARGLRAVPSGPVHFDGTPAIPIGGPGWYLQRPGFAWGGIGVAACWYGGARAVFARLRRADGVDDLLALSIGTIDVALHACATAFADAAARIDRGDAAGADGVTLALRVRSIVAAAAELTLAQAGHSLGPAPLAFEEEHARRFADLEIYIRQHHAERDLATLGHRVLAEGPTP